MAVVTVSRQLGSGGTALAQALAERLGWEVLDKEALEKALVEMGIPDVEVRQYDERRPGFWQTFSAEKDRYLHFLKTAIYRLARTTDCVIVGRGGQLLFQGVPGVLKIRIIASPERRVRRIMQQYSLDDQKARQLMKQSDTDRSGYHRFFFNARWDAAELYDVMVNTDVLREQDVISLLVHAMESECVKEAGAEFRRRLDNLCLVQEVITSVVYEHGIRTLFLEVTADAGKVTLNGAVQAAGAIQQCVDAAKAVPGVEEVVNRMETVNYYVGM